MPIKPENVARYPAHWPQIRTQQLGRARYCCQWPGCGARHHAVGRWQRTIAGYVFQPLSGSREQNLAGQGMLSFKEARAIAKADRDVWAEEPLLVIVLTIAHLDHTPENCEPENLRAWCQRHHLAYDQDHHVTTAYMTRRERRNTLELPL
jgi:hypothetical protein